MKCSRCLSVCLESDDFCPSCRQPWVDEDVSPTRAGRRIATRMAAAFAAIGACLAPVFIRAFFPQLVSDLLQLQVVPYAVGGAALGWVLGYAFGAFAFEIDARGTAGADRATFRRARTAELWPWRS